ncbi:MAG: UDP-galactopyranose mutase [Alphaproteobacteria bacterium]|nr:UDP-galactopyranose mutase [Alphaproteobacteria bacterium]
MSNINLVVGAGFSGATIARKIAEDLNEKVVVIDCKDHIAGNAYDYRDENGIMIHKYGSHIFHTNLENVWQFLSRFTSFNTYMHKVIALIDGIETTIPFNLRTLYDVFPETLAVRLEQKLLAQFEYNKKVPILEFQKQDDADLKFLANYVYEKVFLHYTTKQWGLDPTKVDGAVTARVPVYISCDERYFTDKYQGIPLEGYTKTVEKMLNHPNIEVKLNTPFEKSMVDQYKRVIYTGSVDQFFDYKFGELPYRSVYFKMETFDKPYYQSNSVVNYPCNYDFTRIHEYKYYLDDQTDKTVIAKEYSTNYERGKNEPFYPIASEANSNLYAKYKAEADKLNNVYFLGRLGEYKYYDMDKAVGRALDLFEALK